MAMANGVSFVCANCDNFWWSAERKLDGCKAHHERKSCSGPVGGFGFPLYEGPLQGHLARFCFLTGEPATAVIRTKDGREIGATKRGIDVVQTFSKNGLRPRFVTGEKADLKP
jgi:hypothetical protein